MTVQVLASCDQVAAADQEVDNAGASLSCILR
jgi:hypothetical protein